MYDADNSNNYENKDFGESEDVQNEDLIEKTQEKHDRLEYDTGAESYEMDGEEGENQDKSFYENYISNKQVYDDIHTTDVDKDLSWEDDNYRLVMGVSTEQKNKVYDLQPKNDQNKNKDDYELQFKH